VTLDVQFLTMGTMILCGVVMGVVFDAYRVLTGQLRISRWLLPLLDLLYWTGVTVFVFRMLNHANQGRLRFFVFVGLSAGVLIHYLLFSGIVIRFVLLVIRAVRWTAALIRRLFLLLVVRPLVGVYRLIVLFFGFLVTVAILMFKIVLQLLYPFRILGKWLWKLTLGKIRWAEHGRRARRTLARWFRKIFH
jgi:spore cortex biosynthesis protein YabQ